MNGSFDLQRLLRPRSIAVIGGGVWCANVIEQCQKMGFSGPIWPVHPKRKSFAELPAYPDIASLPEAPDAAFIGVNRDITIDAVAALSERGAGGAICFASGFQEADAERRDGALKQQALLEAAGDMPFIGPNCYGFLNYLDDVALWPDQHGGVRSERGVAIITQSSNIAINLTMQQRGLPLAYVVTVGNQAKCGMSDIALALLQDERVTALGLHIEGIDDLNRFEVLAQEANRLGKPIVALKLGRSEQARQAAISHTASLTGDEAGAEALFKRLGIGQVFSLSVLLETLKLLHVVGPLASNRVASMSCSGGEASLMADAAYGGELVFPPLDKAQKAALCTALGPHVALANPLDYHTYIWGDEAALTECFTAMMLGDLGIGCVVLDFPRSDRCDPSAWEPVIRAVDHAQSASGKPVAILSSLQETLPESICERLIKMGVMPFSGMMEAISAMEVAAKIGAYQPITEKLLSPPELGKSRTMNEADAKSELAKHGVRIPKAMHAESPVAAAKIAAQIGFPIALKGEGIAHKTEAGAVALNLLSEEDVFQAANKMPADYFLVEEMIHGRAVELLIGVMADPAHGYVLTLAAGGILTELIADSASLLIPASRDAVGEALKSLRVHKLLEGYRGGEASDLEAILDAVMVVQRYVASSRPYEVEINPLLCGPEGAIAVDALIRIGDKK